MEVISTTSGHGSDFETELNAKRVMTNIRLTFVESAGDFPVDNDFRRIGIIKDPYDFGTTTFSTSDTLSGLKAVKITGATGDFTPDEMITQTVAGGTAKGTVVSWTLDADLLLQRQEPLVAASEVHAKFRVSYGC